MHYQNIIFDWDGTIAMTLHLWLAGYRIGLQNQQHTFPDALIAKDFFYEHDKAQEKYPTIDFERLVDEARHHVFTHVQNLELYPGARDTLTQLVARGVRLALASSSSRRMLEAGLELHNLVGYFDSMVAGDDVTRHKPHPEAFVRTFEMLSISPGDVLIIGDSHTDIRAGRAAGTACCLFTPPENVLFYDQDVLRAAAPDYAITALPELIGIAEVGVA